ncbi:MAG: SecDF P1 head subdomain-containing protein, partial [Roseibacillus sp.]
MLPPIQFVLPLRASTCLLVAGCKSKSRKPSGPPTFQAVLTILGSGPADNPTVARQLQGRAGALDTFLETKAGSAADKIVVFLYQDTEGEPLLLEKKPSVTGAHIASAWPDTTREGVLNVTLTPDGGTRMERLSKPMEKGLDRIAIVLNDEVISALVVQAPLKAEFIIQGLRDHDELTGLANALNIPLAAELKLESLTAL